jgi:hypothetical protein
MMETLTPVNQPPIESFGYRLEILRTEQILSRSHGKVGSDLGLTFRAPGSRGRLIDLFFCKTYSSPQPDPKRVRLCRE